MTVKGFAAAAAVALAAASAAAAQEGAEAAAVGAVAFSRQSAPDAEMDAFLEILENAASRAFAERGVSRAEDGASGSRWSFASAARREGADVAWTVEIRDAADGDLLAADAFSAYAGLSARPLLESSAEGAVVAWHKRAMSREKELDRRFPYRLRFASAEDGVAIYLGSAAWGVFLGTIEGGVLEAPYLPLRPGNALVFEAVREGKEPARFVLPAGPVPEPVEVPRLLRIPWNAVAVLASPSRPAGAALSYRRLFREGTSFARADASPWLQFPANPGLPPVLHAEVRAGGGAYLPFASRGLFRMGLGAGIAGILTALPARPDTVAPVGFDLLLDPVCLSYELRFGAWSIVLEQRFPYSFGLPYGFLQRGWLRAGDFGPLHVAFGAQFEW